MNVVTVVVPPVIATKNADVAVVQKVVINIEKEDVVVIEAKGVVVIEVKDVVEIEVKDETATEVEIDEIVVIGIEIVETEIETIKEAVVVPEAEVVTVLRDEIEVEIVVVTVVVIVMKKEVDTVVVTAIVTDDPLVIEDPEIHLRHVPTENLKEREENHRWKKCSSQVQMVYCLHQKILTMLIAKITMIYQHKITRHKTMIFVTNLHRIIRQINNKKKKI